MKYQVRTCVGQVVDSRVVEAPDQASVYTDFKKQGIEVLSVLPIRSHFFEFNFSKPQQLNPALFADELLALVSAGLSVNESLDALIERSQTNHNPNILIGLRKRLQEGQRLSQALKADPENSFPALLIGMVQAAEDTSNLSSALQRFVHYANQMKTLNQRIASACTYPIILLFVGGLVTLFLLGHVVPKFAGVYQGSKQTLPWASQVLLDWGQWIASHQLIAWGTAFAIISFVLYHLVPLIKGGQWWAILRWLPGTQDKLDLLDKSRMYLTLGMLLESGMPIGKAMLLASSIVPKNLINAWEKAHESILDGLSLTQAFEQAQLSTAVAARLMLVGERSGQIGAMLTKTASFHENETTRWIEQFTKTFEPLLMVSIGLIVGLIVILLYIPVFELAGNLQ
jgi:general secretion pathway protein F